MRPAELSLIALLVQISLLALHATQVACVQPFGHPPARERGGEGGSEEREGGREGGREREGEIF